MLFLTSRVTHTMSIKPSLFALQVEVQLEVAEKRANYGARLRAGTGYVSPPTAIVEITTRDVTPRLPARLGRANLEH